MLEHYLSTAVISRKYRPNRPTLQLRVMSSKFALSDIKRYAGEQFNFIAGFTGK